MAVGATLVADDRTDLRLSAGRLMAQAPLPLLGRIEARGVGILQAEPSAPVPWPWPATLDATKRTGCHRCAIKIGWGSGFRLCWGPIAPIFTLHCGS